MLSLLMFLYISDVSIFGYKNNADVAANVTNYISGCIYSIRVPFAVAASLFESCYHP